MDARCAISNAKASCAGPLKGKKGRGRAGGAEFHSLLSEEGKIIS